MAERSVKAYEQKLSDAQKSEESYAQSFKLSQAVGLEIQQSIHASIDGLVTKCLHSVYGDRYDFRMKWIHKKTSTECRLSLFDTVVGEEIDPLKSTGGGVVDVIAIALRVTALMLTYPKRRRLLILDEPFKFVSAEYRDSISELIHELSKELGIQFIIVTHIPELMIGNIIDLDAKND
tara:strand:- start:1709 stop:2242 length:534 start_codon:yes stop_codon:yes gene_type:complete